MINGQFETFLRRDVFRRFKITVFTTELMYIIIHER